MFATYHSLLNECEHLKKLIEKHERELEQIRKFLNNPMDDIESEANKMKEKYRQCYLQAMQEAQEILDSIDLKEPLGTTFGATAVHRAP